MEGERSPWRRLARAGAPRRTQANVLGGALALLLGFAMSTQIQQQQRTGLDTLRTSELIGILDSVNQESARLSAETARLEALKAQLSSSTGGQAALQEARQRLAAAQILAGTVAASGSGVRITIRPGRSSSLTATFLDLIAELRDAGAEAIQVNSVRVVASTSFATGQDGRLSADGSGLSVPYTILAIGDSQTLASAMDIPGGVSETVRQDGGDITVTPMPRVEISALHVGAPDRYARAIPAPSSTQSR